MAENPMPEPLPSAEKDTPIVLFGGRSYQPPGDASTLRAAKEAMWADHVEGKEPEGAEWNFWVRLAVLMSDLAGGLEATLAETPEAALYYDQELWVARNYLEMTGRVTSPGSSAHE